MGSEMCIRDRQREMKVPILDPGGLFKDYELHKLNPVSCEIEDMDAISLNYWLTKFVMEVAKDSGERYPPRTVYGIVCGVKCFGRQKSRRGVEST